jgi:uncharacterized membrane protein
MAVIGIDAALYSLFQHFKNASSQHILILDGFIAVSGIFITYYFPEERPALLGLRAKIWCAIELVSVLMLPLSGLLVGAGMTALMVSYSTPLGCVLGVASLVVVFFCMVIRYLELSTSGEIENV